MKESEDEDTKPQQDSLWPTRARYLHWHRSDGNDGIDIKHSAAIGYRGAAGFGMGSFGARETGKLTPGTPSTYTGHRYLGDR